MREERFSSSSGPVSLLLTGYVVFLCHASSSVLAKQDVSVVYRHRDDRRLSEAQTRGLMLRGGGGWSGFNFGEDSQSRSDILVPI